jgi:hypothetical protein
MGGGCGHRPHLARYPIAPSRTYRLPREPGALRSRSEHPNRQRQGTAALVPDDLNPAAEDSR